MNYQSAYEILELDEHIITLDYLKKQYRKMALKHHPDKNGNTFSSNERFKDLSEVSACQTIDPPLSILA